MDNHAPHNPSAVPEGTPAPVTEHALQEALAACIRERDEYLNGWKRAKADLANYKKEEETRLRAVAEFGLERLIRELVRVLDSFTLGFRLWSGDSEEKKGMMLVQAQLEDALKRFGVEPVAASPGEEFNPARHECLVIEAGESPPGTIIEEVERGYALNGKVIKPARVKVVK